MANLHISFEPSAIIQSRRFGCQTVSGLTARELLRPNAFIYQPKSTYTTSPYDIGNNFLSPSNILADSDNSFHSNPQTNSVIDIDNYDPRVPTLFTDDLSLQAIKNLGIQQSDLFFPTNDILDKINGDKRYFETLLIERARKYREEVRKERQKIIEAASKINDVNIIQSSNQSYYQKGRFQRPSTGLRSSKPVDALEKAKIITDQQIELNSNDPLKDVQAPKDILNDKRKKPLLYNLQLTEDRNKKRQMSSNYLTRPSSRKRVIRSSLSIGKSGDLSVNEQKNATFFD